MTEAAMTLQKALETLDSRAGGSVWQVRAVECLMEHVRRNTQERERLARELRDLCDLLRPSTVSHVQEHLLRVAARLDSPMEDSRG